MTNYTNTQLMARLARYIKSAPWWKGKVVGLSGNFPAPKMSNKQSHVQLDQIIANVASIKKGLKKEFPNTSEVQMKSMIRTAHWFNGLLEQDEEQHEDYLAGEQYEVDSIERKVDAVAYKYDQDLEDWFVGYATTFADDPDNTEWWKPWFNTQATSGSSINDPKDMNDQVTTIGAATGVSGTILPMETVLTSTSTNQTIEFVKHTFQPIIDGFSDFKDVNNGRRMLDTPDSVVGEAEFTFLADPTLIRRLRATKQYDGEKVILAGPSVAEVMMNEFAIRTVPCEDFSASLTEDGVCQFGLVANFKRNFQKSVPSKMKWEAWKEIPDVNSKWLKKMSSRLMPFTMPYWNGTSYYKGFFHGSFVYKNDAG